MTFYGVFRHLDSDGLSTGSGFVVRSKEIGGNYADPYRDMTPIWAFTRESLALRLAEKLTLTMQGERC